jgi:hypothetical protein
MKKIPNDLHKKLERLNREVKENLQRKGLMVPILLQDSSIKLGYFIIKKNEDGFYYIVCSNQQSIAEKINLPQTAILVANKLALGKWLDNDLLNMDKKYGFAVFDESICKRHANKNKKNKDYDRAELMEYKAQIAINKQEYFKKSILRDFQKLIEFR